MEMTGKTKIIPVLGREITFRNQRCRDWTYPYAWQNNGETLSSAGCGVFGLCHCVEWLTGKVLQPEEAAAFSVGCGGRGDDGTDRPALLSAMEERGMAKKHGFVYQFDGLRNDLDALHDHLLSGGAALCNLRVGHIVALVGSRIVDGEKQVLAADPYSESADPKVIEAVRECVPGSEVISPIPNVRCEAAKGYLCSYALFWASLSTVRDFNLLHRIFPKA